MFRRVVAASVVCVVAGFWVSGAAPQENYLSFDGGDLVGIEDDAALDLAGGEFTISAWIRPTGWGGNNQGRIVDHGGGTSSLAEGWTVAVENRASSGFPQAVRVQINDDSGFNGQSDSGVLSLNTWQHVAVTLAGGTLTFYVDGVERGVRTNVPTPVPSTQPIRVGNRSSDLARGFQGSIDEVRIWSRALTQQEIIDGMNVEITGGEVGLVAYYRFNSGAGQNALDSGPNGLHGRLGTTILAGSTDPLWVSAAPPGNTAPSADAGPDQTVHQPATAAALDGTISDDGLPSGMLTTGWSQLSGPGTVLFGDATAVDTTATLPELGAYGLRLTVSDGELSWFDDVAVTLAPEPDLTPPLVTITEPIDQSTVSGAVTISATASDNVAVEEVEFFADGAPIATDDSEPYSVVWDSTDALTSGVHMLSAVGRDTSNNESQDSITVTVDNGLPSDLSDWTVEVYSAGGSEVPDWVLEPAFPGARQELYSASCSVLLSDYELDHASAVGFSGTMGAVGSDDDQFGFTFGYQERGEFYLFQWKRGDPQNPGLADIGMHIRAISTGGPDPTIEDFEAPGSTPTSMILEENDLRWQIGVIYDFSITFFPGGFDLEIDDPTDLNDTSWTINDVTFASGRFGFYNCSQGDAVYRLSFVDPGSCSDPDADGICGSDDNCPDDANPGQQDTDGDDVGDVCDECPGFDDLIDADADGVADGCDVCPGSDDGLDADGDEVPDGCDVCAGFDDAIDSDADTVPDGCDACPGFDDSVDTDADGAPDACDVCPGSNDAIDTDADTVPDGCDVCAGFDDLADADTDGVPDGCDLCPGFDDAIDTDADTVPDGCDVCAGFDDLADADTDSVPDGCDVCPGFDDAIDTDVDTVPDGCDVCAGFDDLADADTDGVPDGCDLCPGFDDAIDTDADTVPDGCDVCAGFDDLVDADTDGVPDGCDLCPGSNDAIDTDADTVPDGCDLCPGFDDAIDTDADTVPDGCDVCAGFDDGVDTDADTVPDGCDVCAGFNDLADADADSVPDGCDVCPGFDDAIDTDADTVPDGCDLCAGFDDAIDTDADTVPDGCDTCAGFDDLADADTDGVPDGCDLCPGDPTNDVDQDGVCGASDCDNDNPAVFAAPLEVTGVLVTEIDGEFRFGWAEQAGAAGPGTVYDVYVGLISQVRSSGGSYQLGACEADNVTEPEFADPGLAVPPGDGLFFLIRAQNACPDGTATFGDANRDATAGTSAATCD
ncbi:MAG TPA: LamG-like jellyroll fold domain-containing protein [Candidatus Polarisedimenticolaceae bacterium]|nr:LamG-like jellyroll fold domain-containing protein [Candidatus Polarisedimenticolaceae bacterium]